MVILGGSAVPAASLTHEIKWPKDGSTYCFYNVLCVHLQVGVPVVVGGAKPAQRLFVY